MSFRPPHVKARSFRCSDAVLVPVAASLQREGEGPLELVEACAVLGDRLIELAVDALHSLLDALQIFREVEHCGLDEREVAPNAGNRLVETVPTAR